MSFRPHRTAMTLILGKREQMFDGKNGAILAGSLTGVLGCFLIFLVVVAFLWLRRRKRQSQSRRIRIKSPMTVTTAADPASPRAPPDMQGTTGRVASIFISHPQHFPSVSMTGTQPDTMLSKSLPTPRFPSPLTIPALSRSRSSPDTILHFNDQDQTTVQPSQDPATRHGHLSHRSEELRAPPSATPSSISPFGDPDLSDYPIPDTSAIQEALASQSSASGSASASSSRRNSRHLSSFSYPVHYATNRPSAGVAIASKTRTGHAVSSSIDARYQAVVMDLPESSEYPHVQSGTYTPSTPYFGELIMASTPGTDLSSRMDTEEEPPAGKAMEEERGVQPKHGRQSSSPLPTLLFSKPPLDRAKSSSRMDHLSVLTLGSSTNSTQRHGSTTAASTANMQVPARLQRELSDSAYSFVTESGSTEYGKAF